MNVIWFNYGKKFTILGLALIPFSLLVIFTTPNTLLAAAYASLGTILVPLTIKGAMGWSWKRASEKAWKREERLFGTKKHTI